MLGLCASLGQAKQSVDAPFVLEPPHSRIIDESREVVEVNRTDEYTGITQVSYEQRKDMVSKIRSV